MANCPNFQQGYNGLTMDTFWLTDRTRLCVQYTISLSSLCKLIGRYWTYKMPVRYILSSVSKIKHILSVIHYTICGAVCFQFTHFSCDDWENIYTLSYYHHHQIGSMYYHPLFTVRSWNNGVRCMSFYILMENTTIFFCKNHNQTRKTCIFALKLKPHICISYIQ